LLNFTVMRYIIVCFSVLFFNGAIAQNTPKANPIKTRILFIFDASNSMKSVYANEPRIDFAKKVLLQFVDSVSKNKNVEVALRLYGHTVAYPPGDCKDSKLVVPFGQGNPQSIRAAIQNIKPTGITPIEYSLGQSINDFPDNKNINTVIIITDGIEECGGNPCNVKQKLEDAGIELKPFIIGIGLKQEQISAFDCVGTYYDAEDKKTISVVSKIATSQKLNKTTLQVNLLDKAGLPNETNVNMTFYDKKTNAIQYDLYHTLNKKNNPDTLQIDYSKQYNVIVNTIPSVELDNITIVKATHNTFGVDAAQGSIEIKRENNSFNNNDKVKCLFRKAGTDEVINVQNLNAPEKYLQQKYDIEILTLPRTYLNDFNINKSNGLVYELASAGVLDLKYMEVGDGCVMQYKGNKLFWVCDLNTKNKAEQIYLQPGKYSVVFRSEKINRAIYTIQKNVEIKSNVLFGVKF
jgi:Ca-activated chloride channel homolog